MKPFVSLLFFATLLARPSQAGPVPVRIQCAFDQPPIMGTIEIPSPTSFYLAVDAVNSAASSSTCYKVYSKDTLSLTVAGMKYVAHGDYDVNDRYTLCEDQDDGSKGRIDRFKQIGLAGFDSDWTTHVPETDLTNANNFVVDLYFAITKGKFVAQSFTTERNGVEENCSLAY